MNEPVHAMDQGLQVPTRADMGHGTPVRDAQRLANILHCSSWPCVFEFLGFLKSCVYVEIRFVSFFQAELGS